MRNVGFVESKMDTLGRWSESWPNRFMVFCLLFVILFWLHYEDTHMHAVAHGTEKVEQPERM